MVADPGRSGPVARGRSADHRCAGRCLRHRPYGKNQLGPGAVASARSFGGSGDVHPFRKCNNCYPDGTSEPGEQSRSLQEDDSRDKGATRSKCACDDEPHGPASLGTTTLLLQAHTRCGSPDRPDRVSSRRISLQSNRRRPATRDRAIQARSGVRGPGQADEDVRLARVAQQPQPGGVVPFSFHVPPGTVHGSIWLGSLDRRSKLIAAPLSPDLSICGSPGTLRGRSHHPANTRPTSEQWALMQVRSGAGGRDALPGDGGSRTASEASRQRPTWLTFHVCIASVSGEAIQLIDYWGSIGGRVTLGRHHVAVVTVRGAPAGDRGNVTPGFLRWGNPCSRPMLTPDTVRVGAENCDRFGFRLEVGGSVPQPVRGVHRWE